MVSSGPALGTAIDGGCRDPRETQGESQEVSYMLQSCIPP